jgi:hypothetical protein
MAIRFEPTQREVSEMLTLLMTIGPWDVDGLFDCSDDELEWEPADEKCFKCDGYGYKTSNQRHWFRSFTNELVSKLIFSEEPCQFCKGDGSFLTALQFKNECIDQEPYLGTLLRRALKNEEIAKHAAEAERRYLEDTRFQDGPTEVSGWPPKVMKGY